MKKVISRCIQFFSRKKFILTKKSFKFCDGLKFLWRLFKKKLLYLVTK